MDHCFHSYVKLRAIINQSKVATFPYWGNLRACQVFIVLLTWVLVYVNLFQLNEKGMVWPVEFYLVWNQNTKNWCVCRGLGWDWELNFWSSLLAFLGTHTQEITHLRRTCALHRRHRTPQVSSHSPHILRNHRSPEQVSHTIKSSYSESESDFTFFSAFTVTVFPFFLFSFSCRCRGITVFLYFGRFLVNVRCWLVTPPLNQTRGDD